MKKLITICVGVVLAASMTSAAFAQAAGPTGGGVQNGGQQPGQKQHGKAHGPLGGKALKELNLTPEQKKQVKELMVKFREKNWAKDAKGGKADRKAAMAMRKEFMEDLEKILTPEQKAKLKTLREHQKGGNDKKGGGGS